MFQTKILEKSYNLLNNDGVVWISTPNFESAQTRLQKLNDIYNC